MQLLGNLTTQQFLREYWQKKPLLIRQAIPGFVSPISPEELAGLACEEEVESRMIFEHADETPWTLHHGPFNDSDFSSLPDSHWTLLVQKANQIIPELAEFLQKFDFIPGWRIDDIMISFAPVDGSVGPHLDQYDVFLLQGMGQRRWQTNTDDFSQAEILENAELKILKNFTAENEWVLEPGDMLYLPPNVAHYGVALNDCMTYSVGFRAPSIAELLTSFVDDYVANLTEKQRYTDDDLLLQEHSGEICSLTLEKLKDILTHCVNQPDLIKHWFGRYITESGQEQFLAEENPLSPAEFTTLLQHQGVIYRSEYSRFAFIDMDESVALYVDGSEFLLTRDNLPLVQQICDNRVIQFESFEQIIDNQPALDLLTELYNSSAIWFDSNDNEFD